MDLTISLNAKADESYFINTPIDWVICSHKHHLLWKQWELFKTYFIIPEKYFDIWVIPNVEVSFLFC